MEGALKMKEISYIYASGHPSAELKHGIIALVKPDMPCVFIAPDDTVFDKNVSNIEEVKARKGPVIAVTTEGKTELERRRGRRDLHPGLRRLPEPDPGLGPAAAARLPPGGGARLRCRQAAQPGEERDRRVGANSANCSPIGKGAVVDCGALPVASFDRRREASAPVVAAP